MTNILQFRTCILDSGSPIRLAISSRMKQSGYWVLWNRFSSSSSCSRLKVVRSRLDLRLSGVCANAELAGEHCE